jgi:hypothetical protein
MGAATKLRMAVTPFSRSGPSWSVQPGSPSRCCSASQIRPSGQSSTSVSGGTCTYSRLTLGERRLCRAKPSGWWA